MKRAKPYFLETYMENGQGVKAIRGRDSWADNVISQILISLGNETKKKADCRRGRRQEAGPLANYGIVFFPVWFICHAGEDCSKIWAQ